MAVYPTNDPELVEKLGSLLDVDLDTVISLNNTDGENITSMYQGFLYFGFGKIMEIGEGKGRRGNACN